MNATHKPSLPLPFHVIIALAAIALASVAEYAHTILNRDMTSLLFFGAAAIFWIAAIARRRGPTDKCLDTTLDSPPDVKRAPRRRVWLFATGSFVFAGITFLTSTGNEFTLDNLATWALSVALFLYAFWEPEKSWAEWRQSLRSRFERMLEAFSTGAHLSGRTALLAFILLLGVFFYYHNLDGVPGEMDSDHAEKILDVNDVVTNGLRPIFFERNTGREPLEFYLIAALVEFGRHPIDHMALKLVTATMGILVIPATFLFVSELFAQDLAFLTAALIAISKWPVTIARMGLRFPFTPVFIAPMVYFLFRALKYQRRNDFLMTGFFLGAGLYGYNAFRIAPVLVAAFLMLWSFGRRIEWAALRAYAANTLLIFVFALVIFAPLLRYSVDHPENFWYRVLTRLADEERPVSSNPIETLGSNAINAALMFNWTGDEAWPNSIPGDPALDYVSGGLFLLGVVYAVYQLIRFRERSYAFVLIGLAIMLLPTALSLAFPNENPSNARAGGAIPFVFILVALPLAWLWRSMKQVRPGPAAIGVTVVLLTAIAGINYVRYFRDFDQSYREKSWNSDEVAQVIRGFAESVGDYAHVWILLYPHWVDTRNVAINMGRIGWDQTLADVEQAQDHAKDANNKLYVLNPNDAEHLVRLQDIMPNGQLRVFKSRTAGHNFVLWYVPGEIAPDTPPDAR